MDRWVNNVVMIIMMGGLVYVIVYVMVRCLMGNLVVHRGRVSDVVRMVIDVIMHMSMSRFPWSWYVRVHIMVHCPLNVAVIICRSYSVLPVVWVNRLMVWDIIIVVMHWSSMSSFMPVFCIIVASWMDGLV